VNKVKLSTAYSAQTPSPWVMHPIFFSLENQTNLVQFALANSPLEGVNLNLTSGFRLIISLYRHVLNEVKQFRLMAEIFLIVDQPRSFYSASRLRGEVNTEI
jgi:hypothetical protein